MSLFSKHLDRYAELDQRGEELVRDAKPVGYAGVISPTHERLAEAFGMMMEYGLQKTTDGTPISPQVRVLMRTVHSLQPLMVEELARVPEIQIQAFVSDLVRLLEGVKDGPPAIGSNQSAAG